MKTTSKAQTDQWRTCKLCDSNGFITSGCLLCFGHVSLKGCDWGHCQLVAFFAKSRWQEFCQNFAALLHSMQKMISQITSLKFTLFLKAIGLKEDDHQLLWKKKAPCGRKRRAEKWLSASQALLSDLHQMYWSDVRHPTLAFFPWWHWTEEKTGSAGDGASSQKQKLSRHHLLAFYFPFRTLSLSRSTDSFQIFFWPVRLWLLAAGISFVTPIVFLTIGVHTATVLRWLTSYVLKKIKIQSSPFITCGAFKILPWFWGPITASNAVWWQFFHNCILLSL